MAGSNYWDRIDGQRISRRRALRGAAIGGAGLAGAALIGCGGDDSKPAATSAASKTNAGATSAPAAAAKPGGRLVRAQEGDPPSFDQHGESTTLSNLPSSPGYNTLVQFDSIDGLEKPSSVRPDLASSWEVTPDGMTYTFKMVQNAKFHDSTPFTAADVQASIQRQITPPKELLAPPRQGQLGVISKMETPDNYTLKISMKQPVSPLSMLPIMAQGWMVVYSKKDVDANFDFKKNINGTGPFRFTGYTRGNKVTWDKNKDYFIKDRPFLDGLDIFIVPDASTRLANFLSGQIHTMGINAKDYDSVVKTVGDKATLYKDQPSLGFTVVNFNTSKAPWKDERVRRAINLAENKEDAIKVLTNGDGTIGGYFLPGGEWALSQEEIRKLPGYAKQDANSVVEAKKLLQAAGVQDGLNVTLLTRNLQSYQDHSIFLIDQLASIGMKAKSDIVETATAYDRMIKRDFDLAPWGHGVSLDDPDALWQEFYIQGAPRNYSELSSPEIEAAFKKQTVELDPAKRKQLVNDMERITVPALGKAIVYWSRTRFATYKTVHDYVPHVSSYNNQRFANVWLSS